MVLPRALSWTPPVKEATIVHTKLPTIVYLFHRLTWYGKWRICMYSASRSSIRTIWENISTRWPVSFRRTRSLSNRYNFPLPRRRLCQSEKRERSNSHMQKHSQNCFLPAEDPWHQEYQASVLGRCGCNTSWVPLPGWWSQWCCPWPLCSEPCSSWSKSTWPGKDKKKQILRQHV